MSLTGLFPWEFSPCSLSFFLISLSDSKLETILGRGFRFGILLTEKNIVHDLIINTREYKL